MKKFLVLGVLVFLAGSSFAKISNVKVSGSLEVQSFSLNNSLDLADYENGANDDKIDETRSRVLVGISAQVSEGVRGKILLSKNNRRYGEGSETVAGWGSALNKVLVENAYLVIDDFIDIFKLTLGRQFYGEKGDLVLYYGPTSDDNLIVFALDGLKAEASVGPVGICLISGKVIENAWAVPSTDEDLAGIILNTDDVLEGLNLSAYAYNSVDKSAGGIANRDDLRVLGLKAGFEIPQVEGLKAKAEYAMNAGPDKSGATTVNYTGNALFLSASYDGLNVAGELGVSAEYASASGDDATTNDKNEAFTPINPDLRYGEIWANSLGNVGITDCSIMKAGVSWLPDFEERLSAKLCYLTFTENEVTAGQKDDWGSEIDLKIGWKQSDSVSLELILAQLTPGDALKNALGVTTDDPINKLSARLKVSF